MKVILAGGGTGGHLIAGLSIAEEISLRFPGSEIIFFGTDKKKEAGYIEKSGHRFVQIKAHKLKPLICFPVFLLTSLIGTIRSIIILARAKPDVIIGLGGYGSVLPVIAAFIVGIPIALIEQNVIPGRANLFLARWVDIVLCHWESSAKRFKKSRSINVTGIPIRKNIIKDKTEIANNTLGLSCRKKTLLIMGGSQGAQAINKVVLQSVPALKELVPDLQIVHLTGKPGYEEARTTYNNLGIRAFVSEFFDDIGILYGMADLIICRAGANTVAEISEVGIPAIFIPYPYATNNHQYWNAYELAGKGGAVIIKQEDLGPEKIIETVKDLLMDEENLNKMKKINRNLSKPLAAKKVVDKICETLELKNSKKESCLNFISLQGPA